MEITIALLLSWTFINVNLIIGVNRERERERERTYLHVYIDKNKFYKLEVLTVDKITSTEEMKDENKKNQITDL